jgi:hypothetical protein
MKQFALTVLAAVVAGGLAGAVVQYKLPPKERIVEKPVQVTVSASKHAWPDLTEAETITLGEALGVLKGVNVSIVCNDASCNDLAHDIDNAMEIADARSTLDNSPFPLGYGMAVFVQDGDKRASVVAAAIKSATNGRLSPDVKTGCVKDVICVVIGKRGR